MNFLLKTKKIVAYEKSLKDEIDKLQTFEPAYEQINYFIDIVFEKLLFDNLYEKKPKVVLLGTNIPEEIVYASGNTPYWVMGGSLSTIGWSDNLVPRDTDSVSRSLLGMLVNDNFEIAKDALIIVPLINDSFKKITYLLKNEGYKVHYVSVPSTKNTASLEEWKNQIDLCVSAIKKHTKKIITPNMLKKSYLKVKEAKKELNRFIELTSKETDVSNVHKLMVVYSYYCMENIEEWTKKLKELNHDIDINQYHIKPQPSKGNVIVMGSPIYYPNFKIPFLLQDVGLNMVGVFDYSTHKFKIPLGETYSEYINNCFTYDISSAYASNDTIYEYIKDVLSNNKLKIDGVVYHIIKGQLDFDFELDKFEQLFALYDIPVFRLETDYNYQDIEQLRIRMEAFSEVLEHKKISKGAV